MARLFACCLVLAGPGWLAPGAIASDGAVAPRQSGTPLMRVWTSEDYAGPPGNRCVIQNPRTGFIYVGNNGGVLEFDGVRWRLIKVPGRAAVRTLAVDGSGRVWAANEDTIAYLAPDPLGQLRAVSAVDRLPPSERVFRGAAAALSAPDGVYVAAAQRLFFFADDDAPARVWPIPDAAPVLQMGWSDGVPYVQLGRHAVWLLREGRLERIDSSAGPEPAGQPDYSFYPVTERGGEGVLCAAALADGRSAFGTAGEGLIVCDHNGGQLQRIDRSCGLPSNRIEGLCEDAEGGVWLALPNGLARVQLDSPYAVHGAAQHFDGTPTDLQLYRGSLYVSGSEGLARREPDGHFQFLQGLIGVARELVSEADRFYVTGMNLQTVLPGDRIGPMDGRSYSGLVPLSGAAGAFVRGAPDGLWLVGTQADSWAQVARCRDIAGQTVALVEQPAGIVWAFSQQSGLWRVDFRSVVSAAAGLASDFPARNLGPADGLPAEIDQGVPRLFRLGRKLDVIAGGRLLSYDEAAGRFRPETRIVGWAGSDAALARTAEDGTVWLRLGLPSRRIFHLVPIDAAPDGASRAERWRAEPLPGPALSQVAATVLLREPSTHTLWIGGPGTLISQDLEWRPVRHAPPLAIALRRLETAEGTVLWADGAPKRPVPALPPTERALRFVFASPTYASIRATRVPTFFRTQLEGLDAGWSKWERSAQRDFTNLPYRAFTFRVQARDDEGRLSPEASLAFAIRPPWWLTRTAETVEVLLAIAGIAAATRYFTQRALRLRVRHLEATAAVTAERLRLARDMHDDLGSGLGRVALLGSDGLIRLDDRAAVEASLRKMTATAQSLSRAMGEIIWAIHPENDTLPKFVEHLACLADETLGDAGIRCAAEIAPDLPSATLGAAARHAALLAFKEALHNTVKYSGAATAQFGAVTVGESLVLTLRDDGRGFAAGEVRGTGHGLKSIVVRLAAVGGSGEVNGMPGAGVTVTLRIPLERS